MIYFALTFEYQSFTQDIPEREGGSNPSLERQKKSPTINSLNSLRRERLPNLWFLRISQNTQTVVYQLFVKLTKNQNITKYLSVSQFLGVKLGVDFEFTPKR